MREIFDFFYPDDTPLRRLLLKHSLQVRDKALAILDAMPNDAAAVLDRELVAGGALLHDIGVGRCHAPGILCEGEEPYIAHGVIGAKMLRDYGAEHGVDLEPFARICERHTGTGISADEIRRQCLPLPERDFFPETPEEKLICLADKFFSKSGDMAEKPLPKIRAGLAKFGDDTLARLDGMLAMFGLQK